ncbi:low molecular weight phosphotyrosine protein phosphatase [Parasalinivibrio latis]|uniref:low molecular weight protein-tyrosine-phosphatase n=1 Tax=Parasalinivibrio latis TaxID=2952610 RepID=UPI0030E37F31
MEKPVRLLVVCMGNICRSPTGEAILRAKVKARGMNIEVDSAGTIGAHKGEGPDRRAKSHGEARGYRFDRIRSRKVHEDDFRGFDMILAADRDNLEDLLSICPAEYKSKVSLFLSHSQSGISEIPDPYYGGAAGFEYVLDVVEEASDSILDKIAAGKLP